MAGDAGALTGFEVTATDGGIPLLGRSERERTHALLLGLVGRQGGVERRLEDLVDFARQETEGFAHEVLIESPEHRRLRVGGGDLLAGLDVHAVVDLRQGERHQELALFEGAGRGQEGEVSLPLRRGQRAVRKTRRGIHAQPRAGGIDE